MALIVVLLVAMAVTGTAGLLLERVAYRPLRGAPRLSVLITAVGASFALEYGMALVAGPNPQVYPVRLAGTSLHVLGARLTLEQTVLRGETILVRAAVTVVAIRTAGGPARLPQALRALSKGPDRVS